MCVCVVAAMTIAQQITVRSTEDTMRDTDDWTRAGSETGTGSRTEQPKAITLGISPRTCTTTDTAARESVSGKTRTGGRAAGVSTNEGGVEPGPIATPPRWVRLCPKFRFNSSFFPFLSSFFLLCLSFCNHFFFTAHGRGKYYIPYDLFGSVSIWLFLFTLFLL